MGKIILNILSYFVYCCDNEKFENQGRNQFVIELDFLVSISILNEALPAQSHAKFYIHLHSVIYESTYI